MSIRFVNTRTGREVAAKDGRDVARMVKIEQDRRGFLSLEALGQALKPLTPQEKERVGA